MWKIYPKLITPTDNITFNTASWETIGTHVDERLLDDLEHSFFFFFKTVGC